MANPIDFPENPAGDMLTSTDDGGRIWKYEPLRKVWRLIGYDAFNFVAGVPITVDMNALRVKHDFDVDTLPEA